MSGEIEVENYAAVDHPEFWLACRNDDVPTVLRLIKKANDNHAGDGKLLASYWGAEEGEGTKLPIHEVTLFSS